MKPWWLRLSQYARPYRTGLLGVVVLMFVGIGINAAKPWPLKLLVDYVLVNQPLPDALAGIAALPGGASAVGQLAWLAASTVLLFLASQTITVLQEYAQTGLGNRMVYDLGAALFDHLQRLSLRFHNRHATGDLVRRVMTDSGCVRDLALGVFLPIFTSLSSLAVMFYVLWQLNPTLALLALVTAPFMVLLVKLFDRPMAETTYQHETAEGELMALAEQTLSALPVIQAFTREAYEDARFKDQTRQALSAYLRAILAQLKFKTGVSATTAVGTAVLMGIGGLFVLDGTLTVGDLLVFLSYLASLYVPMETLAYLSSGYASAAARARRVLEVLDTSERLDEAPDARPLPTRPAGERGRVRFEDVTFGYAPDSPVLQHIDVEAQPGEVVALVGPTGAGKSTLVSLIPRLFDPWEGRILIDGMDVRQAKLASLRSQVAVVLQDPFLLPLSVAENIAYARPDARREEIEAAARAARADEFIRRLPNGYATVIGERGATLSGGQRQRLAIARALLKDAPILILDEPTAALDTETETELLATLETLMAGRTTFIIAHRLSTIRQADHIIVLQDGKVVEAGTQSELLETAGLFHRYYTLQHAPDPTQINV